jgi:hypothetical protein
VRPRRIAALAAACLVLAGASCSRNQGSDEAFCKEIRRTPTLESVVTGFADADPEELDTRLDAARDAYGRLRRSAPSGVRGDVGPVVDLADAVIAAVDEHHDDPEAVAAEVREAVERHDDAAAAAVKVAAYAKKSCGVDLNPVVDEGD